MRLGNKLMTLSQEDFSFSGEMNKKEKRELEKIKQRLTETQEKLRKDPTFKEEPFDLEYFFSQLFVKFPSLKTRNAKLTYSHRRNILFSLIYNRIVFMEKILGSKNLEQFIETEKRVMNRKRKIIPSFLLKNTLICHEETFTLDEEKNTVVSLVEEGKFNENLTENLIDYTLSVSEPNLTISIPKLISLFLELIKQFEEEVAEFGSSKEIEIGSNFGNRNPLTGGYGAISNAEEFKELINLSNKKKLILMLKKEVEIILKIVLSNE